MVKKSELKQCMYVLDSCDYLGIVVNEKIHWLEGENSKFEPLSNYDDDMKNKDDSSLNVEIAFNAENYEMAKILLRGYVVLRDAKPLGWCK